MELIDLHMVPAGAVVDVAQAAVFPVLQNGPVHAYLCADEEMRLITTDDHGQLFGASTRAGLIEALEKLGYKPFSSDI